MQKPNYYAIIPANVRYDKEITPNAKLLYGEITSLCNDEGICWATNDYFAQLYNVSKVTVSKWVNELFRKGYINSEIVYKDGSKQIIDRYLRIVNDPIKEKFNTPIKENFKENNTSMNNTSRIKENKKESPLEIFTFSESVSKMIETWLGYKKEKGQTYKPTGLNVLLKKLNKWTEEFGDDYVVSAIEESISHNYSGIFPATKKVNFNQPKTYGNGDAYEYQD